MVYVDESTTIVDLVEQHAGEDSGVPFCYFDNRPFSIRQINDATNRLANGLAQRGVAPGDRVAVMLPNHPDHIITMLALMKMGAIWVPMNVRLRGASLSYIVGHSDPHAMIADERYRKVLDPVLEEHRPPVLIWRGRPTGSVTDDAFDFDNVSTHTNANPPIATSNAQDVVCISYTSGTTGEPKGVLVTDKMLRTCAVGAILGGDISDGDTLLVWEPLYHVAGSEIIIVALLKRVTIALLERFSASQFWDQVYQSGATHIHYVGGILQILLKQAPHDHGESRVRIAWGGGCTKEVWREFEDRFGVQIREVYGLTEASSISTINTEGRVGSIGKPAPYFDVDVVDDEGTPVPSGTLGEIVIREQERGLVMPGYFRNPAATDIALRDGWLLTGDLGRTDEDGFLYYAGRKKDSVRRRGENISAWEVERVVNEHPDVELSALVGVASEIGESDLKVFVKLLPGQHRDPEGLVEWCALRMPDFQVPRYVAYIDDFELTPTHRIRKEKLSRETNDCWDRECVESSSPVIAASEGS